MIGIIQTLKGCGYGTILAGDILVYFKAAQITNSDYANLIGREVNIAVRDIGGAMIADSVSVID